MAEAPAHSSSLNSESALQLADWRRQVSELYAAVRNAATPEEGWWLWRRRREELFLEHPQSPLLPEQRTRDFAPRYFEYDPALRFALRLQPVASTDALTLPVSQPEEMVATRIGAVTAPLAGGDASLSVAWLSGYAGGLFLSFRDATSGAETYGAGRYVLDTAKGADLGRDGELLIVDLNFAYQPSCSYDPRWACPLAPRENWLQVAVRAGERMIAA